MSTKRSAPPPLLPRLVDRLVNRTVTGLDGLGHDLLGGGAGNDYMNGGSGNDAAFGGSGLDDFEQIGRDPWVYLYPASWTRFGWQTRSAGVQDFNPSQDLILS